nr:MAG TPA: hypothetical protein [Caudoviricetes sp.]
MNFFQNILIKINKFFIKKVPRRAKKVLGNFALNSENGVKAPRWRILGIKKCHLYSSKINFANY